MTNKLLRNLDETTGNILRRLVQKEFHETFEEADTFGRNDPKYGIRAEPGKNADGSDRDVEPWGFEDDVPNPYDKYVPPINVKYEPKNESAAADEAKKLGLTLVSFGMYADDSGKVTHRTVDGKLVPVTDPKGKDAVVKSKSVSKITDFGITKYEKSKGPEMLKNIYKHLKAGRKITIAPDDSGYQVFFEPDTKEFRSQKIG